MRRLSALLCLVITLFAAQTCFAEDITVGYDAADPDIYVVSGTETIKDAYITMVITYAGKSLSDVTVTGTDNDGIIAAAFKIKCDFENGSWKFQWEPTESGYYDISVSAEHFAEPYKLTNIFIAADRRKLTTVLINGSKNEIVELLRDINNVRSLVSDSRIADEIKDTSSVGDVLYSIREELSDKSKIVDYTDLAAYMQILKETGTVEALDAVINELERLGNAIDNAELYKSEGSTTIKKSFASRLSKAKWSGIKDFDSCFTDELILAAVEKAGAWSDLDKYLSLLGNSVYESKKSVAARSVVSHSYSTIEKLVAAIESAVSGGSGSGSSGGGGGGGGGSSSGGSSSGGISSGNIGQSSSVKKIEIDTIVEPVNEKPSESYIDSAITFSDVPESHWGFDAINYIRWRGMVYGYEDGSFRPENKITRAEFLTMLCNLFNLTGTGNAEYEDVAPSDWYAGCIGAATAKGLVQGSDGYFKPNDNISRQDMAVMTYRFCNEYGIEMDESDVSFVDQEIFADYAKDGISRLAGKGIVHGMDNGEFVPNGNTTRAEAAQMLYNILMVRGD